MHSWAQTHWLRDSEYGGPASCVGIRFSRWFWFMCKFKSHSPVLDNVGNAALACERWEVRSVRSLWGKCSCFQEGYLGKDQKILLYLSGCFPVWMWPLEPPQPSRDHKEHQLMAKQHVVNGNTGNWKYLWSFRTSQRHWINQVVWSYLYSEN